MTARVLPNLAVAVLVTAVVALAQGGEPLQWVVGGVYALALALGVWCGSAPALRDWTLRPRTHAYAATAALVVGGAAWWVTGRDNGAFWGVGVVAGIATSISFGAAQREA